MRLFLIYLSISFNFCHCWLGWRLSFLCCCPPGSWYSSLASRLQRDTCVPPSLPMLADGGDVVLWGFSVRGIGFRCRIALLGGFGLVSLLMRLYNLYQDHFLNVLLFLKYLVGTDLGVFNILILLVRRKLLTLKLYITNICYSSGVKFCKVFLSYGYSITPIRQRKKQHY